MEECRPPYGERVSVRRETRTFLETEQLFFRGNGTWPILAVEVYSAEWAEDGSEAEWP